MNLFLNANYNFIGNKTKAFIFSGTLIALSIILLIWRGGPNLSIDFTGGTLLQIKYENPLSKAEFDAVKKNISSLGMGTPEIKYVGDEHSVNNNQIQVIVKKSAKGTTISDKIQSSLKTGLKESSLTPEQKKNLENFKILREEVVGPKVGKELGRNAIMAIFLSLIVIVVYVGIRFKFPYGVAAIAALFHDVTITLGFFALTNWEVSLPIIAAILTIVGYSLNDTIVVFDRIRETINGSAASKLSFDDNVNKSINQTLSRTIITSLTTLVVVVTIFIAFINTEDVLKYFSGALIVGILVGTYSSIFIASPILVIWNKKKPIEKLEK